MTHHWWGEYSVWPPTATPPLVNLHLAHYYTHTCSSRANEGERQRKRQRKDKDKCQMKIHNFLSLSFFCRRQRKYTTPYPSSLFSSDLSTFWGAAPYCVFHVQPCMQSPWPARAVFCLCGLIISITAIILIIILNEDSSSLSSPRYLLRVPHKASYA